MDFFELDGSHQFIKIGRKRIEAFMLRWAMFRFETEVFVLVVIVIPLRVKKVCLPA